MLAQYLAFFLIFSLLLFGYSCHCQTPVPFPDATVANGRFQDRDAPNLANSRILQYSFNQSDGNTIPSSGNFSNVPLTFTNNNSIQWNVKTTGVYITNVSGLVRQPFEQIYSQDPLPFSLKNVLGASLDDFSMEAWIWRPGTQNVGIISIFQNSASMESCASSPPPNAGPWQWSISAQSISFGYPTSGSCTRIPSSTTSANVTGYVHNVITRSGTSILIYQNGVNVSNPVGLFPFSPF